MRARQKAKSRFRVHWGQHSLAFARLGLIAMFQHPTRINMSYKLNANVCCGRHEITSQNNPGNGMDAPEVKGPPSFLLEPVSQFPQGMVHRGSFFWSRSDNPQCSFSPFSIPTHLPETPRPFLELSQLSPWCQSHAYKCANENFISSARK